MTGKQWLLITLIVVLNIVIFGALLGESDADSRSTPTPTWTPHPTFTPVPFPTATAILMPTLPVPPTLDLTAVSPRAHVVNEGETLESIAQAYKVSVYVLRMLNRIPDTEDVHAGQELIIPPVDR